MRRVVTRAIAVFALGQLLAGTPVLAAEDQPKSELTFVEEGCAYCANYVEEAATVQDVETSWRRGFGYLVTSGKLDSEQAVVAETGCAYCGDYSDQTITPGPVASKWRAGVGYADETAKRRYAQL